MITKEDLDTLFILNEQEGRLYWKVSQGRCKKGTPAGAVNGQGYYIVKIGGKSYYLHRLIWMMVGRSLDYGQKLVHVDGNKLNNRPENIGLIC